MLWLSIELGTHYVLPQQAQQVWSTPKLCCSNIMTGNWQQQMHNVGNHQLVLGMACDYCWH
jgi:hypothetical protein